MKWILQCALWWRITTGTLCPSSTLMDTSTPGQQSVVFYKSFFDVCDLEFRVFWHNNYEGISESVAWWFGGLAICVVNLSFLIWLIKLQDRLWRKTRSRNGTSKCIGVDANRNFGFKWNSKCVSLFLYVNVFWKWLLFFYSKQLSHHMENFSTRRLF